MTRKFNKFLEQELGEAHFLAFGVLGFTIDFIGTWLIEKLYDILEARVMMTSTFLAELFYHITRLCTICCGLIGICATLSLLAAFVVAIAEAIVANDVDNSSGIHRTPRYVFVKKFTSCITFALPIGLSMLFLSNKLINYSIATVFDDMLSLEHLIIGVVLIICFSKPKQSNDGMVDTPAKDESKTKS